MTDTTVEAQAPDTEAPEYVAATFSGSLFFLMLESDVDLSPWVPYPLQLVDPHKFFVKVYQLRMRPKPGAPRSPAFSQYTQACVTVLAAPPGQEPGHHNLVLWEEREWSITPDQIGWRKKLASVDTTFLFPTDDRFDADEGTDEYQADVHLDGKPLMTLRANLDGSTGEADPGVSGGFFAVSFDDDGDPLLGTASATVNRVDVANLILTPPTTGTGSVEFFESTTYEPGENALVRALNAAKVTGAAMRNVGWTRAAPAPQFFHFGPEVDAAAEAEGKATA
jgi:Acetoacetate decarboxylase (ADC)